MNNTPVILVTYKRAWHTAQVLNSLKKNNVRNLFIFSDGPKNNDDLSDVYETRLLFQRIDWTRPTIIEQDRNVGLANSIVSAINYVFEKCDRVILLEDDCVPQKHFFDFIGTCLDKYENNEKVFGISGYTVPIPESILRTYPYDLYFFPRIGSWGWATWKRAWQHFESDLAKAYRHAAEKFIDLSQGGTDIPLMLNDMVNGRVKDIWTLNWVLSVYLKKGYYIYPTVSHIENIGMDGSGLHCGQTNKFVTRIANEKPSRYPDEIIIDENICQNFRKYYDIPKAIPETPNSSPKTSDSLKVVHLCTLDFGGAGKAAYRLHKGLRSIGVDSTMLVLSKGSGDPSVKVLPTDYSGKIVSSCDISPCDSPLWIQQLRKWQTLLSNYPKRPAGLEIFTDAETDIRLDLAQEVRDADIVHLHWVAGEMDYSTAPVALGNKPIVWTLHDMNPFTGGCHYAGDCLKYKTSCKACPQLGSSDENDLAHHIWKQKFDAYKFMDINIVTPSRWLGKCASESTLFSKFPITVIPYGFPLGVFKPYPKTGIRKILNIPESADVILFGAESVVNTRKGFRYLLDALNKITLKSRHEIIIVTFGHLPEGVKVTSRYPVYSLGPIEAEKQLAMVYSTADVFVIPSLEDNLPNTVVEAMACGVPVVGFDIGGVSDMVEHKKTGYLAKPKDIGDIIEGIDWVISSRDRCSQLSRYCREKVERVYALEVQAKTYNNLYSQILHDHLDIQTKISYLNQQGEDLLAKVDLEGALDVFTKALEIDPDNAITHNNLGLLYHNLGNKEKALSHYLQAAQLHPENISFQKNLADFYFVELGRVEDALKIYVDVLASHPKDIETLLIAGHICVSLDKFDDAEAFYKILLEVDPGNVEAMKVIRDLVSGVSNQEEKRGELKSASLLFNNEKTNKKWPRISIVTPSFNQGQFLEECIDSVLSQNYANLEYIIMDGGSSDDSVEIIRKYEKHLTYWQSRPDEGQYAAINEGFKRTTGTIMTWLNSDDKFHPNAFKIVSSIFLQREDIEWLSGRPNGFGEHGDRPWVMNFLPIWSRAKYLKKEYRNPFIQQEGTFWRRSLWEKAKATLRADLKLAGDLELWVRFFRYARLFSVDTLLAGYRSHPGQKAQVQMSQYIIEAEKILDEEIKRFRQGIDKNLRAAPEPILIPQIRELVASLGKLGVSERKVQDISPSKDSYNLFSADSHKYLVSAIISTCNSERFIAGCIEDLEVQTIASRLEIIIVDSGSEQDEEAIVKEFQKKYTNIKYIRTEKRETVCGAWNRGIKIATAKYITTANTDDRHRKDALEQMVNVLEMRPDIALVYADVIKTETENETFECCTDLGHYQWYDWDRNILLDKGCFIGPQPMWRRDVHGLYGYFDDSMVSSGDYEFWLRISQTYNFFHLRMPLGLFLLRSDSIENRERETKRIEDLKITNLYKETAERGVIIGCRPLEELKHYIKDSKGKDKDILEQLIDEIERLADLKTGVSPVEELWSAEDEAMLKRAMKKNEYVEAFRLLKKAILFGHHENNHIDALFQVTSKIILKHTNWFNSRENHSPNNYFSVNQPSEDTMAFVEARNINGNRKTIQGGVIMESAEMIYQGIQAMINSNNPEASIWALERFLETYPDYALACNDLGVIYYNHGNKEKALEHYEKAVQLSPGNIIFQKNLADFYYVEQVRIQEALEIYVKVLAAHPEDMETLLIIGHICVSLKKFEDARVFYNRVLELEPWNLEAREHLDKMAEYEEDGAAKSAEEMYQNIQESMNTITPEEAINKLQELLSLHPDYALANNDLGVLFYNQGNKEQALRHYEQAARLLPDNITFQKNLADFYYVEQARVQEALEIYVKVLSDHPEDVETLLITGHICVSLKKFEDARVFYNRVLELEPWNIDARQNLNRLEDYEQGKISFEAASALAN